MLETVEVNDLKRRAFFAWECEIKCCSAAVAAKENITYGAPGVGRQSLRLSEGDECRSSLDVPFIGHWRSMVDGTRYEITDSCIFLDGVIVASVMATPERLMITLVTTTFGPIGSTNSGVMKDLGIKWAEGGRWCRAYA